MQRVQILKYKGATIFYTDLSDISPKEAIPIIMDTYKTFSKEPEGSILSLVNMKGVKYDSDLVRAVRSTTKMNNPFVKATAVCGLNKIGMIAANSIAVVTGRQARYVDDIEEGKEWLYKVA